MPTFRKDIHLGHDVAMIDTDDIVNGAITEGKMANDSVSTRALQDRCVTEPKLAGDAVSNRTIQDKAVTEPKLADGSVSHRTIQPNAVDGSNIKPGSIGTQHLEDGAVTTPKIKDGAVTPEKRSNNFDDAVVKPYVNEVDNKYNTITSELDGKYEDVTEELYSMIASLQVGGIALSGKFGDRTDIGIHQKTLTKAIGKLWDELATVTGKTYMDFTLTVQPTFIAKEGSATVTASADCTVSIMDFDSIKFYVNDELKAESHDVSVFVHDLVIENDNISTVKAVGVIMGKRIVKETQVEKLFPFFMGSGQNYTDVTNLECQKELVGTLEGDYDLTVKHNGDYMFIIIPASHKDEFRRADMNGLGLKVEIPLSAEEHEDFVVYKSLNTYKAGTYNIDIDINS